ncbi:MAG TPA: HK97 family phage prohead protease [Candidatus Binataceae bacterium]|nr:HK97 family phage prohead protease [Candidatus Binataceae bacterium]
MVTANALRAARDALRRDAGLARRRVTMPLRSRFLDGVTDRQVRVVASDGTKDRMGDVLEPGGVKLDNFRRNPIILAQHDPEQPIARCPAIAVAGGQVIATIEFPPAGVNARSDEYLALLKANVLNAVSVGFVPLAWEPLGNNGLRYTSWELVELSVVSVPANANAIVTERSFREVDRRVAASSYTETAATRLRRAQARRDRIEGRAGLLRVVPWTPPPGPTEAEARIEAERLERAAAGLRVAASLSW